MFKPGDAIIYQNRTGGEKRHTVLDPTHTKRGKLRVRGPRGGLMTTWWTWQDVHCGRYRLERPGT